jgi:transposase
VPRHSSNTERGSQIGLHKRKRQTALRELIADKQRCPGLSLRQLAQQHALSNTAVQRRWQAFEKARAAGRTQEEALHDAVADNRGGHNRTFTPEHEQLLGDIVRAAKPSMAHAQIQAEALRFKRDVDVASGSHATRSAPLFRASDHFVTRFKSRQRLSSHRTAVVHESKPELHRDMELEKISFVVEVRDAIERCGAALVFNMDETPASLLDPPVTAVVARGSKQAAKIATTAKVPTRFTTFPTISAAGDKLPLCAILRGKTPRCLKKVQEGASADVKQVHLYHSESGWMKEELMAQYFRDILLPHTHGRPAALIVDCFQAHWTPATRQAAAAINLQLIQVPGGCTAELQPLDAKFHGPLLMKRKQIWAAHKLLHPFAIDSAQATIERAQQAYAAMPTSLVLAAFRNTWLID